MAIDATIPALSREYLRVEVDPEPDSPEDLVTLPVYFAFLTTSAERPEETDWVEGSWQPDADPPQARVLFGPGGATQQAAGKYYAWLWVDGAVEEPVRPVGILKVI